MRRLATAACLAALAPAAAPASNAADGVWRTEANDEGAYLEVTVAPCAADAAKTCGIISRAHAPDGDGADYPHLGKRIIEDMVPEGPASWSGGTIWAPDDERTYRSNMELQGDVLTVEGCVLVICRGQDWTRAQ